MLIEKIQEKNILEYSNLFKKLILDFPYFPDLPKKINIEEYTGKKIEEKINKNDFFCFVAKEKNKIVGFILGSYNLSGICWVDWIGVDNSYRKNGIATNLINYLIKFLKKNTKVHKIVCVIRTSNKPSQRLFSKSKFKKVAEFKKHWYKLDYQFWELFI